MGGKEETIQKKKLSYIEEMMRMRCPSPIA
jgi:hypothetical protein